MIWTETLQTITAWTFVVSLVVWWLVEIAYRIVKLRLDIYRWWLNETENR